MSTDAMVDEHFFSTPVNTEPIVAIEEETTPQTPSPDEDIDDSDLNSSDMSDYEEEGEPEQPVISQATKSKKTVTKPKNAVKAPKKKAMKKVKEVKVKKPRTIRRPYKSMEQEKLVAKQVIANARFEVASKRMTSTQNQLERFNYELAIRKDTPEGMGVVGDVM
jgi:hypothetical protein